MKALRTDADSGSPAGDGGRAAPSGAALLDRVRGRGLGQLEIERLLQHQRERHLSLPDPPADDVPGRGEAISALAQLLPTPHVPAAGCRADPELVVAAEPFSDEAEAFRDLRTQLLAKALARRQRAALAVVSPGRGEGRSYVAANLAACFGQLGGRTLLIDADLRTPRLHRLLGMGEVQGLSSALGSHGDLPLVQPVAQVPGLYFIPAGAVPPNPLELLQGPRFSLLLYDMLCGFEHVVVDTPADSMGADGRLVAAKCGCALVVGRKDRTPVPALQALLSRIGNGATEITGVVMNRH